MRSLRHAFVLSVGYAVAAGSWIVFSGRIAGRMAGSAESLERLETLKGLGFVLVTSTVLFVLAWTLLKRLYERSAENEDVAARYLMLFESNPIPMWVYDRDTLAFLEVNAAAEDQYGYTREEFCRMTIADIRPVDDVPALLDNVAGVREGIDHAGVWRHITRDGQQILVEITSHTMEYRGRRAELVLANDVTERESASGALRETTALLEAVVDCAPLAVIVTDRRGVVTMWNDGAERTFGWKAEEVIGSESPIVPPGGEDECRAILDQTAAESYMGSRDVVRLRKDGSRVEVELYTSVLRNACGVPQGMVALLADVTERRRADAELDLYRRRLESLVEERTRDLTLTNERLRVATETKSRFLASMSHELRTPLNSIIGFSGVMLSGMAGGITDEQKTQVGMINRSGKHLLALINDILDLSKIEAGRMVAELSPFDARDVCTTVVDTVRPQAESKGLAVSLDLPEGPVPMVSDRVKLQQILINLAANAVKFTDEGSVGIAVSSDGDRVNVRVSDSGRGIAPQDLERIFEEFSQVPGDGEPKPSGTGLGLAISRRLARMLEGDLDVQSVLGEGSVFTLRVPREATSGVEAGSEHISGTGGGR